MAFVTAISAFMIFVGLRELAATIERAAAAIVSALKSTKD